MSAIASATTTAAATAAEENERLKAADIERLKASIGDDATPLPTSTDEETKSPEEQAASLQWLRDRGIEVETPEDRTRARAIAASMTKLKSTDQNTRTFTYVHIPADATVQMQEIQGVVYSDARGKGDQLLTILKSCFSTGTVDADALRRVAQSTHLGTQESGEVLSKVTPASIASDGGAVETFRLADGMNLYLDAVSALKSLPPNTRAAQLARQCGYGEVPLFGDMFVGRLNSDSQRNVSFTLKEMAPDQPWLKEAVKQNLQKQAREAPYRSGGMTADELNAKGGQGEGYSWKQTTEDVEVSVPLPSGTRGKQCKVKFGNRSLKIDVNVDTGVKLNFTNLYGKVHADECVWTISDGVLVVTMEKAKTKEVWPSLDA